MVKLCVFDIKPNVQHPGNGAITATIQSKWRYHGYVVPLKKEFIIHVVIHLPGFEHKLSDSDG